MQIRRTLLAIASGAVLLAAGVAQAGQYAEFEEQLRAAYAPYRNVLFQTNKNDKAASEQALKTFSSQWTALAAQWSKQPPPQYLDDAGFGSTLAEVASVTKKAEAAISKGELADAHEILEKIRDLLGELRNRNGVVTFSDRMNAYHEAMEHVLAKSYGKFDANGLGELREDASVLAYLFRQLETHPPGNTAGNADFARALSDAKASVDNLLAAARKGEAAAAEQAVKKLKQPYSVLFLKFG
jgi:phage shock protein A